MNKKKAKEKFSSSSSFNPPKRPMSHQKKKSKSASTTTTAQMEVEGKEAEEQQVMKGEEDENGKKKSKSQEGGGVESEASIGKDVTYFGYYGQLANQQNMLADSVRTGSYQWAITRNPKDFVRKVVLDVGAGSGILSFFAAQAGASKVYAVEASEVADAAALLAASNGFGERVKVIKARLEDVSLPEKVDTIISEPMGVLLVHERMIESFVRARDMFLKEGGAMYPSNSTIFLAPFTDGGLYAETMSKVRFWHQTDFYGLNLSALSAQALAQHFAQPVVGCFDPRSLISSPIEKAVDFLTVTLDQLRQFDIDYRFEAKFTGLIHGIAGWFDVSFEGSDISTTLSTSPYTQKTHWYQVRFLFVNPVAVNAGQVFIGKMALTANDQRSYDVNITGGLQGTPIVVSQLFHLHEQQYWYPNIDPSSQAFPESFNLYETS